MISWIEQLTRFWGDALSLSRQGLPCKSDRQTPRPGMFLETIGENIWEVQAVFLLELGQFR